MSQQSIKRLEMGYTPAEFRKTLNGQFIKNTPYTLKEISEQEWIISIDTASVNIIISEAAPRKIAMLCLPVLNTRFELSNMSASEESHFMKIFFRYFHKGGG